MQRYELLQQIGKGSYGKVYTARNLEDNQLYVLKRIPFEGDKAEADAALRESNVLSLLRHPHIVPYKEFFNYNGDLCLIMAHCEGGDLFHHVKLVRKEGRTIAESQVWQWLVQLLLSLSYCHSKRILHRDVKTQNIFMTTDGRLMLGDFGLAKQLQRTMEMARTPIGTPYYMAPEIYEEEPYSFKSDVWALGCVMYEVLTGRPAFAADNLSRVVIKVLKGNYDPLPDHYSVELRTLISSMLTRNVKQRPTVNELLQHSYVLARVECYLKELSEGGVQAGWSTWRMKLPTTLLTQMAQVIVESERLRPGAEAGGCLAPAVISGESLRKQGHVGSENDEMLSPEELIEKFGLQSLLEDHKGKTKVAGRSEGIEAVPSGGKEKVLKLLAAVLHPDDGRHLNLESQGVPTLNGGAGGEVHLLTLQIAAVKAAPAAPHDQLANTVRYAGSRRRQSQVSGDHNTSDVDDDCYSSDFEEAGHEVDHVVGSEAAAQLLGLTGRGLRGTISAEVASVPLRSEHRDQSRDSEGAGNLDETMLSAALPKAGFGFGAHTEASRQGISLSNDGGSKEILGQSLRSHHSQTEADSTSQSTVASSAWRLAPLTSSAYTAPQGLPPISKPPSFCFASPPLGLAERGPASPDTPQAWRMRQYNTTAAETHGVGSSGQQWASGQIRLAEALSTRSAFLHKELAQQLGSEQKLCQALAAVKILHQRLRGAGRGDDSPLGDGELREALMGVVSPAHLELAPLLDELTLLKERFGSTLAQEVSVSFQAKHGMLDKTCLDAEMLQLPTITRQKLGKKNYSLCSLMTHRPLDE